MNTGKILVGVLAGAAAGALAGILFAPDKGRATRQKITRRGEELMNTVEKKIEGVTDGPTGTYDGSKNEVRKLVEQGKKRYDAVMLDGESVPV